MMQLVLLALVASVDTQENPIRRIVNLLQKMQSEVQAEQARDDDLNEKFACYCKTNDGALSESTAELREKIPQIEASIKEAEGAKAQLEQELAQHKEDRENAKASIASATSQREKEAAAYSEESTELKSNIAGCGKAIDAISTGMAGSFLQSNAAGMLRELVDKKNLGRYQRSVLTEFLSASTNYAPASGEIVGILKQLKEDMEGELSDATKAEDAAIAEFEALVAAKEKEIAAATAAIEDKTARVGETAVQIVNLKNDLEDTKDSLDEDTKFLMELKKSCASEGKEYEERKAMRSEELVAISETIKILNDDDALDLFKKTLPSPSLLQVSRSSKDVRQDALAALGNAKSSKVSFIALALEGKKVGFEKVIKMIDEMVVTLKAEQTDDDTQKAWCEKEFDTSEDKEKETKRALESLATQIAEMTDAISTLKGEIEGLVAKIAALDKMVAEATETRKEEHALFVQTSAENNAALQLLEVAKNRLNKFYNPAVYKPPPKRELTEEERLYVASGGVLTTPAPGGIAGTGITVFAQVRAHMMMKMKDAPPPPPETVDAYQKSDSSGPLALIDRLKGDLEKDTQAIEMEEKEAQKDYEELMAESAATRAQDSKTITEKEGQKAGLEGDLEAAKESEKATKTELLQLHEYIAQLHGSCDFLLQNYDLRKEARASEVDALKNAKAVLSGADYSFTQVATFLSKGPRGR